MPVITTPENDIKERLSIAFLTALAARAGCQIMEPKVDKNAIDAIVSPISGTSAKLDVQLKATAVPQYDATHLLFDLPVHTYDKLRNENVQNPALLVVLVLPDDPAEWLGCSDAGVVLRKCAYWVNLAGQPATTNTTTQRVRLPIEQVLNVETMTNLFEKMDANMRKGVAAL